MMSVQDREVPGQPGQAAAQQGQTEVVVHRHPPTPQDRAVYILQKARSAEDKDGGVLPF